MSSSPKGGSKAAGNKSKKSNTKSNPDSNSARNSATGQGKSKKQKKQKRSDGEGQISSWLDDCKEASLKSTREIEATADMSASSALPIQTRARHPSVLSSSSSSSSTSFSTPSHFPSTEVTRSFASSMMSSSSSSSSSSSGSSSSSSSSSSRNSPDVVFTHVVGNEQAGSFDDFMKLVSFVGVPKSPFVAGHCFFDSIDCSLDSNQQGWRGEGAHFP